jgi:dynein heavy chain
VVNAEKPALELEKQNLVRKQNEFKVTLAQLEDELLAQLSAADPQTILDNYALVDGLETTKKTAIEILVQVKLAKETEDTINGMREKYRSVAQEASMLFFMITQLSSVEHMYQYSLDSFVGFLYRAIDRTVSVENEQIESRVERLVASIRITIFKWVSRGLFERHKLILSALLAFRLLERGLLTEEYNQQVFAFLLTSAASTSLTDNPIAEWLPNQYWNAVQALIALPGFEQFAQNMERDAPSRFKDWFNEQAPEEVKLPLDWKRLDTSNPLQKLLVLKSLRPDRLTVGLSNWIGRSLPSGRAFTECDASLAFFEVLASAFDDSDATTPIFFILSAGTDPVQEVEKLGRKLINLQPNVNYHNVAMGQGQDGIAMAKLDLAHKEGHWVMLQNIHLMPRWCSELEKKLDQFAQEGSHANFRCFLSADPSVGIPIGILDRSIKLTNEPPQGLTANLKRAFAFFPKDGFEERDSKVKAILYGLCHFHSIMLERKKFGPLGYNMNYPFSIGDLRDSALVLYNYMENSTAAKIPWDDLRYIFGEIMYGGHIVDDWDRRLCKAYLDFFMQDGLLDEAELIPFSEKLSLKAPPTGPHERFIQYIDQTPGESPVMFGLHPNAEIGFRTNQSDTVLSLLRRLNVKQLTASAGAEDDGGAKTATSSKAEQLCSDILDEITDINFATDDIAKAMSEEEKGPYQYVFLQECDCMNMLVRTMRKSLKELKLGFKGELTMSESMEQLALCLTLEQIPPRWEKVAFPSTRGLLSWLQNLKARCGQLEEWTSDPVRIPKVVDLSKLFNPQSFLTAIKQTCCQQQKLELDKLVVVTDVTKREKIHIDSAAREGAYVTGVFLEGARWDIATNSLEESRPKELFCPMPVIHCRAVLEEEVKDSKNVYVCPTYATTKRRPYYVFSAQLKTKAPAAKWAMAGVALVLDIGQ